MNVSIYLTCNPSVQSHIYQHTILKSVIGQLKLKITLSNIEINVLPPKREDKLRLLECPIKIVQILLADCLQTIDITEFLQVL